MEEKEKNNKENASTQYTVEDLIKKFNKVDKKQEEKNAKRVDRRTR